MKQLLIALPVLLLTLVFRSEATTITLTFNELNSQPADGLTTQGVTFAFSQNGLASANAVFGDGGPPGAQYLTGPVLDGAASGTLTLLFGNPTSALRFGAALNSYDAVSGGLTTSLYGSGNTLLTSSATDLVPLQSVSEGLFSYSGTPVSRAVLSFVSTSAITTFGVDNLTYDAAPVTTSTPEPSSTVLFLSGALVAGAIIFKSRFKLSGLSS